MRGRLRRAKALLVSDRVAMPDERVCHLIDMTRRPSSEDLAGQGSDGFLAVYDARGRSNVPQDDHPHTVELDSADARPSTHYRCIPMTDPQVFARLILPNPFPFPLPAGTAQVFTNNAHAFFTPLKGVGEGGEAFFPLGVEQRLKVSRNVTYHQEEKGITGGSTEATHGIEIGLRSRMPDRVTVEVLERIPVARDGEKKLDVRVVGSEPQAESVEFVDQARVLGMQRWVVDLEPAAETRLRLAYTISLPAKMEVVGGNRRA